MNRKGIVSEVDRTNRMIRVVFTELDNSVTASLPILDGVPELFVGDMVAAIFFTEGYMDGVIVGRIWGGS